MNRTKLEPATWVPYHPEVRRWMSGYGPPSHLFWSRRTLCRWMSGYDLS